MIECINEIKIDSKLGLFGISLVNMGGGKKAHLCVYSDENMDPGEECLKLPKDTMKIALFDPDGNRLWTKDLGKGVMPGVWFCPVLPFDLDKDGVDEIYFLNNLNVEHPFSMEGRVLEAFSPITGETLGRWKWPKTTFNERMSLAYRYYLVGGYSNGEPVLVTAQGTYEDMYLQGYGTGMEKKWEIAFPKTEKGPRAGHLTPVIDINDDGIDEIFWGERLISLETGEVLKCYAPEFNAHSDILIPYINYDTGKKYFYTTREGDEEIPPRVVTYDIDTGDIVWKAVEEGHMHYGWIATLGTEENHKRVAMAMRTIQRFTEVGEVVSGKELYYFDAYTGEPIELDLPFKGYDAMPVDINGDGISEFYCGNGEYAGCFFDQYGNMLFDTGTAAEGVAVESRSGRIFKDIPCEQIIVHCSNGKVKVFADTEAKGSKLFNFKHTYKGYHDFAEKLMTTGYNKVCSDSMCGI